MTETKAVAVQGTDVRAELKSGGNLHAIIPQDAEQAFRMAQMIVQSKMAPKDMATPQQVVAAIFHGAEIGLQPMQAVQSIAVINGRPTVWGDAALGLVQASGLLLDFEESIEGEGDGMSAFCRAKRKDNPSAIRREFSVADAKMAGLWNKAGPWKQYPKRMLQMRARSWVLRDGFADILKGTHIREEVMDYRHPAAAVIESQTPIANADALRKQAGSFDDTAAETQEALPAPETDDEPTLLDRATAVASGGTDALRTWWNGELDAAGKKELASEKDNLRKIAAEADKKTAEQTKPAPERWVIAHTDADAEPCATLEDWRDKMKAHFAAFLAQDRLHEFHKLNGKTMQAAMEADGDIGMEVLTAYGTRDDEFKSQAELI